MAMTSAGSKIRAARTSIATAIALAALKFVTGAATGSMAVLSSAIDSLLDILMSGVNYFAISRAEEPADECHPFGHGKYETVATLVQAFCIAASGGWIIFESVRRLTQGTHLVHLEGGISVLVLSIAVSWSIGRYLKRMARKTGSPALEADSLHFSMDVYTNLALAAGLVIIALFEITWLDPLLSIFVGLYILYEAAKLIRRSMGDVLDEHLPEQIRDEVARLVEAHKHELIDFHDLRTRRAGSKKIMDFHLTVCKHLSVEQGHAIADHLEKRIQEEIRDSDVTIHIEPCMRSDCPGIEQCPTEKTRLLKEHEEKSEQRQV